MAPMFCIDLLPAHQSELLAIARQSIQSGLQTRQPLEVDRDEFSGPLAAELASFVTLRCEGQLRGCVGSLEARGPLARGVAVMAYHAAFRDVRFAPLGSSEIELVQIGISVLSTPEPLHCSSESDLVASLLPGVDGLLLKDGNQPATFLPQVWDQLDDPAEFVRRLKRKAGWPDDYWSKTIRAYRYRALSFDEAAVAA